MKNEKDCQKTEKYLFADCYLSDEAIDMWQQDTIKRFSNRDKNDLYQRYVNWKKEPNEIAVFTLYAYADLSLNKKFDCIFKYDNPDEFVMQNFVLIQSIYEGFYPIDTVEHGHKHLLIFRFENQIPAILFKLHQENSAKDTRPKIYNRICFCSSDDFETISKYIKSLLPLFTAIASV